MIKMKGISPLIASVILIALTLAIAGILSTWAIQFVGRTQTGITTRTECIGALQFVSQPRYSAGNLTFSFFNTKTDISLENMTAILSYSDKAPISTTLGTLPPQLTGSASVPSATKPANLKIFSANCADIALADTAIP